MLCVGLGVTAGALARRWTLRGSGGGSESDGKHEIDRLSESLAFVGGALGIILGLLLVSASQHFDDARVAARAEAGDAIILFHAAGPYPAVQRDDVRRSVVCLMRSTANDDWAAARARDLTGAENTTAWAARVQAGVEGLLQNTDTRASNHYFMTESSLNLDRDRQLRQSLGLAEIPASIWLVIAVGIFVFIALLEFHLASSPRMRLVAIVAVTLVLVVIVAALDELDHPFSGNFAHVQPQALEASLQQLENGFPGSIWRPCPVLAASVDD